MSVSENHMSYEIGIANIRQMIKGLNNRPGLRFHAYKLKADRDSNSLKLIIWRGNELFEPVPISTIQLRECEESDKGYLQLELYLKNEIYERLHSIQ